MRRVVLDEAAAEHRACSKEGLRGALALVLPQRRFLFWRVIKSFARTKILALLLLARATSGPRVGCEPDQIRFPHTLASPLALSGVVPPLSCLVYGTTYISVRTFLINRWRVSGDVFDRSMCCSTGGRFIGVPKNKWERQRLARGRGPYRRDRQRTDRQASVQVLPEWKVTAGSASCCLVPMWRKSSCFRDCQFFLCSLRLLLLDVAGCSVLMLFVFLPASCDHRLCVMTMQVDGIVVYETWQW